MRIYNRWNLLLVVVVASSFFASASWADAITDWNLKAAQFTLNARYPSHEATRALATAAVAVADALAATTDKPNPLLVKLDPAPGASIDALTAAATHAVLIKMVPSQEKDIEAAYQDALSKIAASPAKDAGIALGERAAAAVFVARANDGSTIPETYRPVTKPGVYAPTVVLVATTGMLRKPWVLTSNDQFRPGPPPALTSAIWARDYNEIKALGARVGSTRTAEQTEIARFWEAVNPIIYMPVVHSVANMPGTDPVARARLIAVAVMAADDAFSAVYDAKYHYNFWRPMTAIRNGDIDGNKATERDPSWLPMIETPLQPEYPCAHCVVAGAYAAVLKAALGPRQVVLTSTSPTAPGKPRQWATVDDFLNEVRMARIYQGVHYRNSTEVGAALGTKVGQVAAARYLTPAK